MMEHQLGEQAALFYEFSLDRHVPPDHLLRSIDRFVELDELRRELSSFYSTIGRPSIAQWNRPEPEVNSFNQFVAKHQRLCSSKQSALSS
jgi:transposase